MPERSMPEVPDLNAQYRAERAMRDLTWGPGRTMPEVPQMTQPSYVDMDAQMGRARAQWERMAYQQQGPVPAPQVTTPFPPPQMPVQPQQRRESDDLESALIGAAVAAAVIAFAPAAKRAALRFRALPAKQKAMLVAAVVVVLAVLLYA